MKSNSYREKELMRRHGQLDSPIIICLFVCSYGSMLSTSMSNFILITWSFYILRKKIDFTDGNIDI